MLLIATSILVINKKNNTRWDIISSVLFGLAIGIVLGSYFTDITLEVIQNEKYKYLNIIYYILYYFFTILLLYGFKTIQSKAMKQQWAFRLFITILLVFCILNVVSYFIVYFVSEIENFDKDAVSNFLGSRLTYIGLFFTIFVGSYQLKDDTGEVAGEDVQKRLGRIEEKLNELESVKNSEEIAKQLQEIKKGISTISNKIPKRTNS